MSQRSRYELRYGRSVDDSQVLGTGSEEFCNQARARHREVNHPEHKYYVRGWIDQDGWHHFDFGSHTYFYFMKKV